MEAIALNVKTSMRMNTLSYEGIGKTMLALMRYFFKNDDSLLEKLNKKELKFYEITKVQNRIMDCNTSNCM